MLRTFSLRDLVRIGKRLDRVTEQRVEGAATPTAEQRTEAVELQNRRLRELLRRKPSG